MRTAKKLMAEAALVLAAGLLFAVLANFLSPRGLSLTRDYFPGDAPSTAPLAHPKDSIAASTKSLAIDFAVAQLEKEGLHAAGHDEVVRWYHDSRYEAGTYVFIDARDERRYAAGHIPGAYWLDRYRPDEQLAATLPVCLAAEKIVVYCAGGDCEDSRFAAILLRDAGVAPEKLFVYSGGLHAWTAAGSPVESGERGSGVVTKP